MADNVKRFLHVGFGDVVPTKELTDALEKVFNEAPDWARYTPTTWILWTTQTPQAWAEKIRATPGLPTSASFLIVPIEADKRWGYHNKWFWEWLQKHRE